jgi:hypothetical protein
MSNESLDPDEFLFETVCVRIVYVTNARNDEGIYSVSSLNAETGEVIGRRLLPSVGNGPPPITYGDLAALLGGTYRCASVLIEIEAQKPARREHRNPDKLRRRERGWLRRNGSVPHAVAFESPLEWDFLAEVAL